MRKRSAFGTRRPRGRLKCRRVLCEFGMDESTCERVCEAPRAARRVLRTEHAEWVPGTIRSGWHARETAQVRCASDVTRDLAARVTCEQRTLARMADPSKVSADCYVQGDDKSARIARWKGRTGKL